MTKNCCTPLSIRWRVARGFTGRLRGLIAGDCLPPGCALLLLPCRAIHTFWMGCAIDVVFLSRQGHVLRVCPSVPAWRARWHWRAHAVAELAEGETRRLGIVAGMVMPLPGATATRKKIPT